MAGFRAVVALGVGVLAVSALAGCTSSPPTPKPTTSAVTSTPSPTPSVAPTMVPNGTAEQEKPFFDLVNAKLIGANGSANGRDIVDNLVASGFAKADMQVTPDKTAIGGTVDSILFSVKIGGECLLGQRSGAGYASSVQKALADGTCLVGKTRPIDW
ncbi:MAG: hypothetical protein ABWX98_02435 [Lacisediminihabitans sp.]